MRTAAASAADPNASLGHRRRAGRLLDELGHDALAQIRARLDAHHLAHGAIDRRIECDRRAMRIGSVYPS